MQKAIELLKEFVGHEKVFLTDRGNSAILNALILAKQEGHGKYILIPDQGGWFTFRNYPKLLGFKVKYLKTNNGLIDLKDLKENLDNACALLMTSFAGYAAEQDMKSISKVVKKEDVLLIEDASGAITDKKLADGKYSDIIVGSFGKWKAVDVGYGGFLSTNFKDLKLAKSIVKVHNNLYKDLIPRLNSIRLNCLLKKQKEIKKELKKFKIFHGGKRGLNILIEHNEQVIKYCEKKNYPFIECPNYTKLMEKSISIELKRLECL